MALSFACGSGATGHANAGADPPSDGGTGHAHGYAVTDVYRDSHEHSEPYAITHPDADAYRDADDPPDVNPNGHANTRASTHARWRP